MSSLPALDRNGRLILAAKGVRAFGAGLAAISLGVYLSELGIEGVLLGTILTSALLGTMILTGVVAILGDRIGRRRLLIAGGLLMGLALFIPVTAADPVVLLLIGLSGVLSVTANESTGIASLDQAALPQTTSARERTSAFSWYNVVAAASAAAGALMVGPAAALGAGLGAAGAQRHAVAFIAFALCGAIAARLSAAMDERIDAVRRPAGVRSVGGSSRRTIIRLGALFGLDSFATGLCVQSFLAFWFATRWGLGTAAIGLLFAAGQVLAAASFPVAAQVARRIGLVRTMVFTHIPSSIFLIMVAFAPSAVLAATFLLVRASLAQMDVPARQSYTMAVVDPMDRTAAAAATNLAKSAAQTAGPIVAATLLLPLGLGVPLVACGVLKIAYDVLLYAGFHGRVPPEETA